MSDMDMKDKTEKEIIDVEGEVVDETPETPKPQETKHEPKGEKAVVPQDDSKEQAKIKLYADVEAKVLPVLPKDIDADRFKELAVRAVVKEPKLLEPARRKNLLFSLVDLTRYGLVPDGKEAFINPHGQDGASYQIMHSGFASLAKKSGRVLDVKTFIVREGDYWDYGESEKGTIFSYKPNYTFTDKDGKKLPDRKDRKVIVALCRLLIPLYDKKGNLFDKEPHVEIMDKQQLDVAKSCSFNKKNWDKFPDKFMRKSVLKSALTPHLGGANDLTAAIKNDDEAHNDYD